MSGRIRNAISEKISQYIKQRNVRFCLEVPPKKALNNGFAPVLHLPITGEETNSLRKILPQIQIDTGLVEDVQLQPVEGKNPAKLVFRLRPQAFLEDTLSSQPNVTEQIQEQSQSKVVVEFSSPNIAKPFHVGHLRSTIIGNVISNMHRHLGYKVTNLNYLGDWGTQFGLLQIGVEMEQLTDEQMQQQPIQSLYRAYVSANRAAKNDPTIEAKARQYFTDLESGNSPDIAMAWKKYRNYTIAELEQVYGRLGVRFDQYDWESQYSQENIIDTLGKLSNKSLLFDETDGRKVVEVDGRRVPIIKSDGSTLYLARDIAALMDRFNRFNFDRILYVVDNGQTDHFNACFKTTAALNEHIPLSSLKHVKFGRIHGMSTRSGNAVFLRDVLDEARDIMLEKQLQSPTTKVSLSETSADHAEVSDVLGVSAVIINDLKQRRQRDYNFDWGKALQVNGDTGIKLQYTHCRLFNLLDNVGEESLLEGISPAMEHLNEPEAQELILEIARFPQIVWKSKEQLEACVLVNYLFSLCNTTSRALKLLNVKHERCAAKRQNRILLFKSAKETLGTGMRILGLNPLTKM